MSLLGPFLTALFCHSLPWDSLRRTQKQTQGDSTERETILLLGVHGEKQKVLQLEEKNDDHKKLRDVPSSLREASLRGIGIR